MSRIIFLTMICINTLSSIFNFSYPQLTTTFLSLLANIFLFSSHYNESFTPVNQWLQSRLRYDKELLKYIIFIYIIDYIFFKWVDLLILHVLLGCVCNSVVQYDSRNDYMTSRGIVPSPPCCLVALFAYMKNIQNSQKHTPFRWR